MYKRDRNKQTNKRIDKILEVSNYRKEKKNPSASLVLSHFAQI